jgi:hypothetical protein
MKSFWQMLGAAVLSGAVMSTVLGYLFLERTKRTEEEIKAQFQKSLEEFRSQRAWRERSLGELLAPVVMQLRRTKRALDRWEKQNLYLEMKVMREGNITVRDLLLGKGHLIPPSLAECADRLIEHYDVWLEEFERTRLAKKPDLKTKFVFAASKGYAFPKDCDQAFRDEFERMFKEVYPR